MAGSALNALDNLVRAEPEWSGAWRHRLALKAASACMKLIGRSEDVAALRDAWLLRQPGDAQGPAGNVLAAWRRLAGRSLPPTIEDVQTVASLLGVGWSDGFAELIDGAREEVRTGAAARGALHLCHHAVFLLEFGLKTLRDLRDREALEDAGLLWKEKLLAGDIVSTYFDEDQTDAGIEIED